MRSYHIHQLERAVLERADKIYISLDLTRNYSNLHWRINPPSPNPVVTCKQSAAHMTYLIPAEVFYRFFLVLQHVML